MELILSILVYEVSCGCYTWTFQLSFYLWTLLFFSFSVSLGDTMTLTMALMACLLGYGEVGLWLQKESRNENSWVIMEGNPYKLWIDDCSGEIFQTIVKEGLGR